MLVKTFLSKELNTRLHFYGAKDSYSTKKLHTL